MPNIKSISQSIAKKSGDNCFISELWTWVTLYMFRPLSGGDIKKRLKCEKLVTSETDNILHGPFNPGEITAVRM